MEANHFISELRKQRGEQQVGLCGQADQLPSLRLHLLKAPHPFQIAPPAGDQILRHPGDILHSNVRSMLIKKKAPRNPLPLPTR